MTLCPTCPAEPGNLVPSYHPHAYLSMSSQALRRRWGCAGACSYARGWGFTTIICEQALYIPWLMDRALRAGVSLQCRTIHNLQVA